MVGQVLWNELLTTDVPAARAFYERMFGWTFERNTMPQGGDYWVASAGGRPAAGIMAVEAAGPGTSPQWFAYVGVEDIDACCAALTAARGTVLRPPWDIPEVGRIAVVMDPQNVAFGLMQPIMR